ncbi:MAG: hypothetical protein ACI4MC_05095, partial [Candidatus Coproplasma sp.]
TGTYSIVVTSSGYQLNAYNLTLISEGAEGILVYGDKNYVLDIAADKSSIVLKAVDGTEIATLALGEQNFPVLKEGVNSGAVDDAFNIDYSCYKIETTGWYTITAASAMNIYTEVENHEYLLSGKVALAANTATTVELTAGDLLGVEWWQADVELTVVYSDTDPNVQPVIEMTSNTYTIAGFTYGETYKIKYVVPEDGTYSITSVGSNLAHAALFTVEGDDNTYGEQYASFKWTVVGTYSKELTKGTELLLTFRGNQFANYGNLIITITNENGSSSGGEEETTDLFSASQQGTYVYEAGSNLTFVVEANSITMSGGQYGWGTYNPVITESNGVYTLSYLGYKLVFSFDSDGNIAVTSDTIYDYNSFVAVKQTSGGEEESAQVAVEGPNTISADKTGSGELVLNQAGTWTITFVSGVNYILLDNGLVVDGGTVTVTDDNPKTIVVYVDVASGATEAVISLALAEATGGEEETTV